MCVTTLGNKMKSFLIKGRSGRGGTWRQRPTETAKSWKSRLGSLTCLSFLSGILLLPQFACFKKKEVLLIFEDLAKTADVLSFQAFPDTHIFTLAHPSPGRWSPRSSGSLVMAVWPKARVLYGMYIRTYLQPWATLRSRTMPSSCFIMIIFYWDKNHATKY